MIIKPYIQYVHKSSSGQIINFITLLFFSSSKSLFLQIHFGRSGYPETEDCKKEKKERYSVHQCKMHVYSLIAKITLHAGLDGLASIYKVTTLGICRMRF